jgi:hypothetical protein
MPFPNLRMHSCNSSVLFTAVLFAAVSLSNQRIPARNRPLTLDVARPLRKFHNREVSWVLLPSDQHRSHVQRTCLIMRCAGLLSQIRWVGLFIALGITHSYKHRPAREAKLHLRRSNSVWSLGGVCLHLLQEVTRQSLTSQGSCTNLHCSPVR